MQYFDFDLTRGVTGDPEVIKICILSTVILGLSNAAWIFIIGRVVQVSEIRGGLEIARHPQWGRVIDMPQWGAS